MTTALGNTVPWWLFRTCDSCSCFVQESLADHDLSAALDCHALTRFNGYAHDKRSTAVEKSHEEDGRSKTDTFPVG
ncbi:MAG: hypothetical protein ABSG70_02850 [Terriglobales bacterium]